MVFVGVTNSDPEQKLQNACDRILVVKYWLSFIKNHVVLVSFFLKKTMTNAVYTNENFLFNIL